MEAILSELNQAVGVNGSLIMTKDGVYVAGQSGSDKIDNDTIAARAANIIKNCRQCLDQIQKSDFSQFLIESTEGKIVIYDAGQAYLFVICDRSLHLNVTILDIQSAANKIRRELS